MTAKFDHMLKSGLGELFGRGATGNASVVLTRAKIQIDDAMGKVRAIEADQTRTRAEKSHLLKKLDSKLKETMARAQADLDSTLKADRQRVESAVAEFSMGKMTDDMALGLALHLQAINGSGRGKKRARMRLRRSIFGRVSILPGEVGY